MVPISARSLLSKRMEATRESGERAALIATTAQLYLLYPPADYAAADRILRFTPNEVEEVTESELIRILEVTMLVGKGEVQVATTKLRTALPLSTDALLALLRGLKVVRDHRPEDLGFIPITRDVLGLLETYRMRLDPADLQHRADHSRSSRPVSRVNTASIPGVSTRT